MYFSCIVISIHGGVIKKQHLQIIKKDCLLPKENTTVRPLRLILNINVIKRLLYHAHTQRNCTFSKYKNTKALGTLLLHLPSEMESHSGSTALHTFSTKPLTRQMALHWQTILTHSHVKTSNLKVSYPYIRFGKSQVSE